LFHLDAAEGGGELPARVSSRRPAEEQDRGILDRGVDDPAAEATRSGRMEKFANEVGEKKEEGLPFGPRGLLFQVTEDDRRIWHLFELC
jgi:hypothetical protein